jgi:ABC-type branched-subunit amino acid transport system ATPase component
MLSEAKHLRYCFENNQQQVLRCAQDDSAADIFPGLRVIRSADAGKVSSGRQIRQYVT